MKALVVDDEPVIRDVVAEVLRADGWSVHEAESAEHAFEMLSDGGDWSLVFCDVVLGGEDGFAVLRRFKEEQPAAEVVLMTGHASGDGALYAGALGAFDYLLKPFEPKDVIALARAANERIDSRSRLSTENGETEHEPTKEVDLVGRSASFVELMKMVGRVAVKNLPVLITGESGTGKEVVARAIHRRSPRTERAFVAVNCGAMASELIESELFGHVRGSFTGATADRRGLFEEADGGTVFLDEITETTPAFQVKLLRVLQEGEVRRVGSNKTTHVDVRVIAATNRDPEQEVRAGRFRQDLLYRLNAVTLHLPPLRERREDILPLAKHFAERIAEKGQAVSFTNEAIELLEQYSWPGNIRELENAVQRASALCDTAVRPEDLPERIRSSHPVSSQTESTTDSKAQAKSHAENGGEWLPLSKIEGQYVARVLAHTKGNKQAAARLLGIDRSTLQRMIKRHGLDSAESKV